MNKKQAIVEFEKIIAIIIALKNAGHHVSITDNTTLVLETKATRKKNQKIFDNPTSGINAYSSRAVTNLDDIVYDKDFNVYRCQ